MPPCPGRIEEESFTPALRLSTDSARSPICPAAAVTIAVSSRLDQPHLTAEGSANLLCSSPHTIAEATLGEGKSADGLQSLKWWRQGEVEKVREYCQKDVELTKRIFDYALQNNVVKYRDLGVLKEIKLNTSNWLVGNAKPMTFTLGF